MPGSDLTFLPGTVYIVAIYVVVRLLGWLLERDEDGNNAFTLDKGDKQ